MSTSTSNPTETCTIRTKIHVLHSAREALVDLISGVLSWSPPHTFCFHIPSVQNTLVMGSDAHFWSKTHFTLRPCPKLPFLGLVLVQPWVLSPSPSPCISPGITLVPLRLALQGPASPPPRVRSSNPNHAQTPAP